MREFFSFGGASPIGVHAEEVLFAVAYKFVEAAKAAKLDALEHDECLKKVGDWFKDVTKTAESGREAQLELGAGVKAGTGFLSGVVDLFGKFSGNIKYRSSNQTSIIEEVRKRPGDLIQQMNRLVESIQDALKPQSKRLLIIVEDLDKLSIADARSVFIENGNLLVGIQANIIYTIPIFTFHSPDASSMKAAFDHDFSLPMINVFDKEGKKTKGFDIIKKIVHRRVDKSAITDNALDLLIEKTGGVLRHVFEVLQTASSMTSLRKPPIQSEHIKYGLGRLKSEMGIQIALPPGQKIEGVANVEQLYKRLEQCAIRQREGNACPPTGEPDVQILLQSCALVEYNGKRWLGVHPLVPEFLKDLGGYNI